MKNHLKTRINPLFLLLGLAMTVPFIGFGQDHHRHKMESSATMEPSSDSGILGAYTKIHKALASDSIEGVSETAMEVAEAARKTMPEISQKAETLAQAETLDVARQAFGPLSLSVIESIKAGKLDGKDLNEAYCPMVSAPWIQAGEELRNPYYGTAMPHCGMIRGEIGESGSDAPHKDHMDMKHSDHSG